MNRFARAFSALLAAPVATAATADAAIAAAAPPPGTYACFAREIDWFAGTRAGESETLAGGEWELDIITDRDLLWQYADGESVHNGLPLEIVYRPGGLDQLVARQPQSNLVIRIALGDEPMRFAALDLYATMRGICHFQPRATS